MKFNLHHIASKELNNYIKKLGIDPLVGIEIGVDKGENSCHILECCPNVSKIYGIDPYVEYQDYAGYVHSHQFNGIKDIVYANLASIDATNRFELINKKSKDVVDLFGDNSIDFIFIDGNHHYPECYEDFTLYYPKIKYDGIFAGHDYSLGDVNKGLYQFLEENEINPNKLIRLENDSWMIYK